MKLNRYRVRLVDATGENPPSYLSHRNRTEWARGTAEKHAREFTARFPQYKYTLEAV